MAKLFVQSLLLCLYLSNPNLAMAAGGFYGEEETSDHKVITQQQPIADTRPKAVERSVKRPKHQPEKSNAANKSANLKDIVSRGGAGSFNCSHKGDKASRPCKVIVAEEYVDHPAFVQWNGRPANVFVISIKWPDGDISRYTEVDSGELINLQSKDFGGYRLAGDEVEQDWTRGFVIEKDGLEHVRLW